MKTTTQIDNPEAPKPYQPIETGISQSDIVETIGLYREFLSLPEEHRIKLSWQDESRPRTGKSGYMNKGNRSSEDNKHVFHMTQDLEQVFSMEIFKHPRETMQFFKAALEIHYSLNTAAKRQYEAMEDEIPGLVTMHFPKTGKRSSHTRFLAYGEPKGGLLATGHYDKSTGTIAVAESHGGLRVGYGLSDLSLLERSRFDPVFFPSFGWNQLAEMLGVITTKRAAWHDVIDTGERVDDDTSRWALVHFINPANIYLESTQEQTHTPIPWRGLGQLALRSDNQSFLVAQ